MYKGGAYKVCIKVVLIKCVGGAYKVCIKVCIKVVLIKNVYKGGAYKVNVL